MPSIRANGIRIEYESHGAGRPLVLIAGLGYDRWLWHRMIAPLAAHFRVIAFDNRGVGGSDRPKGPYSASMMAADTAGLLRALGIARPQRHDQQSRYDPQVGSVQHRAPLAFPAQGRG